MGDKDKKSKKEVKAIVKSFKDDNTDAIIDFTIRFQPNVLSKLLSKKYDTDITMLEKTLKLFTTKKYTNMYLFNDKEKLKKYDTINEIIDKYFPIRYDGYIKEKNIYWMI